MRRVILGTGMLTVLCIFTASSNAVVIYQNDFEGATAGAGFPAWNWSDNGGTHTAVYADYDGNMVVEHTGGLDNTSGTSAQNSRFGSKWDITVTGNTSADPADYTISFDLLNVSGDWDPISEALSVVTVNPAVGTDQYGHGYAVVNVARGAGWVHVEFNLADWANNWWQGADWDLTQSTWALEVGPPWPGTSVPAGESMTGVWLMDNFKITMGGDTDIRDPLVLPDNGDGTSGTLQPNNADVVVTFNFKASGDPNSQHEPPYPVNPDIAGHYIYLSNGSDTDPNVYLLDYEPFTHNPDPYLTDPNVFYGPHTLIHGQGKTFYWQVEEGMDDGTGNPYEAGDPNNILSPVWSFIAIGATPSILSGPDHVIADENGDASFLVTTGTIANTVRWFKVVGLQDTAENGETDDIELSDGVLYSGTQTKILTITGAVVADEGQYYCIAYNGDPEGINLASDPSPTAWLWIPRLVSHYPFESLTAGVTPDIVSGLDMTLMSDDTGTDVPVQGSGVPELAPDAYGLLFDNPAADPADPNHADAQYAVAAAGAGDYMDITISVWVYWNGGGVWQRIVDFGNNTDEYIFLTPSNGGEMRFAVKNVDEQYIATSPLPVGEWTQVTATLSGDTARLYVNGELVQTGTITHDPIDFAPAVNNYVGKSQWPDPYFNGMLDDLKIYNYARSTQQIALDYLAVKGDWICDNELYDLPYDFNKNCIVDLGDLAEFAATWLNSYRIYPAP